jgi:Fic family protein
VDEGRWNRYAAQLESVTTAAADQLARAREIVRRAAAVDTGAIEGLYPVDRGFTLTVAMQTATWQAALEGKGERARALIESQMEVYERVLDFATGSVEIGEAWIRELHRELCAPQGTYRALTELGFQDLKLPLAQYKVLPNHVLGRDGRIHSYAPVDVTSTEMHRLIGVLRDPLFRTAHPVLQAAFAHYAFVVIHPFADGNGRVARALGSVYTYRSNRVPLLILADNREAYFDALQAADEGNYQPFVTFIENRAIDAMQLVIESHEAAAVPDPRDAAARLRRLYVTRGGYTQQQVDDAGLALLRALYNELDSQAAPVRGEQLQIPLAIGQTVTAGLPAGYRQPLADGGNRVIHLVMMSAPPGTARIERVIGVAVPDDAATDAGVLVYVPETKLTAEVRLTELVPTPTTSLQFRLQMVAQRILGEAVHSLAEAAAAQFRSSGYLSQ